MWLIFQCTIMIAVGWTGIYYEWTPNPVALGIVARGRVACDEDSFRAANSVAHFSWLAFNESRAFLLARDKRD